MKTLAFSVLLYIHKDNSRSDLTDETARDHGTFQLREDFVSFVQKRTDTRTGKWDAAVIKPDHYTTQLGPRHKTWLHFTNSKSLIT